MKNCNTCGELKDLEKYTRSNTSTDGKRAVCNICVNIIRNYKGRGELYKRWEEAEALFTNKYCWRTKSQSLWSILSKLRSLLRSQNPQ